MSRIVACEYLVVHHSASPLSWTFDRVREVHLAKGWGDVGYQYGIEHDGGLKYGRDFLTRGAHAPPWNAKSWGVCVIGDNTTPREGTGPAWRRDDHRWTPAQWATLSRLWNAARLINPGVQVVGHYEVGSTATLCPGITGDELRRTLRQIGGTANE